MAEEQKIALESESPAKVTTPAPADTPAPAPAEIPAPAPAPTPADVTKDVAEEKIQNPPPEQIFDDSKALTVVESKLISLNACNYGFCSLIIFCFDEEILVLGLTWFCILKIRFYWLLGLGCSRDRICH
jgi:hypothetical protein